MEFCRSRRALLAGAVILAAAVWGSTIYPDQALSSKASAAATPKGAPLKVLVTSFIDSPIGSVPEVFAGAQVAAQNINKAGGIAGRPLKVITCNGKADPKAELACARKAVSQGAIATASNIIVTNAAGSLEILNRANIAEVGDPAVVPLQYTLRNTFPIEYLAGRSNGCLSPAALRRAGGGKVGIIAGQDPIAQGLLQHVQQTVNANPSVKARYAGAVEAPVTTQDFLPMVQKLSDQGASYVVVALDPGASPRFITAAASAGKKWVFCVDGGNTSPKALEKLAPLTKEVVVSQTYPPAASGKTIPLVKRFVNEMNAARRAGNKNADLRIGYVNAARAWFAMQTVAQIAKSVKGKITAKSFLSAASRAKVDLGYAKIDFARPQGTAPLRRLFQPMGFVGVWNVAAKDVRPLTSVNLRALEQGKR